MAGHTEVSGSDEQLCQVGYNACQVWRSGAGRRPTRRVDGVFATPKQEAMLWRATMAANHGEDWMVDLAAQSVEGLEADEEEEEATASEAPSLQASTTGELLHPGAAARTASPGSGSLYTSQIFKR